MESLYFKSYKSKKCQCAPTDHLQEQIKIQAWFSLLCKHIYIYIVQETKGFFHLHGLLPTLADYCIGQKKSQQITYTGG